MFLRVWFVLGSGATAKVGAEPDSAFKACNMESFKTCPFTYEDLWEKLI